MALEAALSYEKQTTSTDLWSLHQQSNDFAGHALVFMLRAFIYFIFVKEQLLGVVFVLKQIRKQKLLLLEIQA